MNHPNGWDVALAVENGIHGRAACGQIRGRENKTMEAGGKACAVGAGGCDAGRAFTDRDAKSWIVF